MQWIKMVNNYSNITLPCESVCVLSFYEVIVKDKWTWTITKTAMTVSCLLMKLTSRNEIVYYRHDDRIILHDCVNESSIV